MARPAGVVRSSASVSETKPTPRCSSSCRVASRSVTDRPQRSSRQTNTTSISRRRAASSSCSRRLPLGSARADFFDLQSDRPTSASGVFPQGTGLHRDGLLILGRNAGVEARPKRCFGPTRGVAKNPWRFRLAGGPFFGHFRMSAPPGRRGSFSARQNLFYCKGI